MLYLKQLPKQTEKKRLFFLSIGVILVSASVVPTLSFAARRLHHWTHQRGSTTQNLASTSATLALTPSPTIVAIDATADNLLAGEWNYLPGSTKTDAGLLIHATGLSIVSQDGSSSIPNPPINLAGTYLKNITGDISITATMQIPNTTTATMQLYSNPPVIADEFRVEKPSLQIALTNGQLKVSVWNSGQNPTTQTFSVPMDGALALTVTRQGSSVQLSANGTVIGTVSAANLFTSKTIWFGFDSSVGDWTLTGLSAKPVASGTFDIADGSAVQVSTHNALGLQALASKVRPGFLVGEAMALGPMVSDLAYAGVALDSSMFGTLTPENDMKMQNLQPQQGLYTFQKADAIVKLARQNGINDIHGHTLVFGEANPAWFNALPVSSTAEKQAIEKIMTDHITTVVKHFGDQVNSWDVVNEPLSDYDTFDADSGDIYRKHKWFQAMGSSYIIKAFAAAYAANPKAILSINEYGLEADGDRWDGFITFLKQFKADLATNKIPQSNISIGFEAHIYEAGDKIDPTIFKQHIETLADLGFKSQISEEDVYNDDGDTVQAQEYADVFNACLSEPSCIAWRGWTLSDKYDYFKDDNNKITQGIDGLFSSIMQPRPGLTAIQQDLTK